VLHVQGRALGLTDTGEQFAEPRGCGVEGFAALDPQQLDSAEDAALVFVVADHGAPATERAFDARSVQFLIRRRSSALAAAAQ
jgi:hypothetical protein